MSDGIGDHSLIATAIDREGDTAMATTIDHKDSRGYDVHTGDVVSYGSHRWLVLIVEGPIPGSAATREGRGTLYLSPLNGPGFGSGNAVACADSVRIIERNGTPFHDNRSLANVLRDGFRCYSGMGCTLAFNRGTHATLEDAERCAAQDTERRHRAVKANRRATNRCPKCGEPINAHVDTDPDECHVYPSSPDA